MRQLLLWGLVAIWAVAFVLSFLAFTEQPTGDGFTRGLNRLSGFLQWQMIAIVTALVLLALRSQAETVWLRRAMTVPAYLAGALVALIAGTLAYAWIMHP